MDDNDDDTHPSRIIIRVEMVFCRGQKENPLNNGRTDLFRTDCQIDTDRTEGDLNLKSFQNEPFGFFERFMIKIQNSQGTKQDYNEAANVEMSSKSLTRRYIPCFMGGHALTAGALAAGHCTT